MAEGNEEPRGKAVGGRARADKLPPERRSEIAKQAADARWKTEPLELTEDAETGDRFVLYSKPDGMDFQLRFEGEEPWATQKQIADLFGITRSVVTRHIQNILQDQEVDIESNVQKTNIAGSDKPVSLYSLDLILAVGYRAGSREALMFRRWANQILRQYLLKGFVIDAPRMKDPQRNDHLDELLEEIEDIRSSEANVWKRTLELISKCSDYHLMTDGDKRGYFATFQNVVHWAVTSHTAAEIIWSRSDATRPYAGLMTFDGISDGKQPKSEDMTVAKNYYGQDEIGRLRMITNLALDFLKSQAEQGRLTTVAQYTSKLRELVKLDGRPLIADGHKGNISKPVADKKAKEALATYKQRLRLEREESGEKAITQMINEAKRLAAQKAKRANE